MSVYRQASYHQDNKWHKCSQSSSWCLYNIYWYCFMNPLPPVSISTPQPMNLDIGHAILLWFHAFIGNSVIHLTQHGTFVHHFKAAKYLTLNIYALVHRTSVVFAELLCMTIAICVCYTALYNYTDMYAIILYIIYCYAFYTAMYVILLCMLYCCIILITNAKEYFVYCL